MEKEQNTSEEEIAEIDSKSRDSNLNSVGEIKIKHDFDLNLHADLGFNLNKFPEEACKAFEDKGKQEVYVSMLKELLPDFF
ncbi:hypothetical protein M5689_013053 [Euphorbia peplus]|nr:hypothetical protein M5689_013053 [Euphorbia peplus]